MDSGREGVGPSILDAVRATTYRTEPLTDALWEELQPLLDANQAEVPHFVASAPVAPRRNAYQQAQDMGILRIYIARDAEFHTVLGYMAVLVNHSLHQGSIKVASLDVVYVAQNFRGSPIGRMLIRHAHQDLREQGVSTLFSHVKHGPLSIGPLLQRLGYEHAEDVWAINLDGKG